MHRLRSDLHAQIIGARTARFPAAHLVTIEFRGRAMTVPVIDAGRTSRAAPGPLDATKIAMACTDLCTVSMRIGP